MGPGFDFTQRDDTYQWFVYPPATPLDAMVIPRTSGKNNNVQINDRVSKAMVGRSHEPYYFSTR
jgi:hypothetical protein